MLLSIVTPAYKETLNLPVLYERLKAALDGQGIEWEWIVVDDHSPDDTFAVISDLARRDARVRGIRFSRNFGSHAAITCALHHARGECAVIISADLQDPPETIPLLMEEWKKGAQIVWAVRAERDKTESFTSRLFVWLYYRLTQKMEGFENRPPSGMDFCLLDRCVIDAFARFRETHVSILTLLAWMGFRQAIVPYAKQPRLHGKSNVSFERKLRLALDTITAFSYMPIRIMTYVGFTVAGLGFLFALFVTYRAIFGSPVEGYPSLIISVLVMGGVQMIMMGVLGEYLWRALAEVRQRPRYIIEVTTEANQPCKETK